MAGKDRHEGPILVAVDFSAYSAEALLWAIRAAEAFGVPLEILHVVHDPGSAPGYYAHTKRKKHLHRLEDAAQEMMEEFLEELGDRHPEVRKALREADKRLVVGLPVPRILELAQAIGAQMIVTGSTGRTGLPHVLLGSKAQKVAQLAPIPVTIVKRKPAAKKGKGGKSE
jgi:nucleotide-binding universal stress UspA family protein